MSEAARDEIFAAALAGRRIQHDGAALVVAEWADPGGGHEPPLHIAPLHVHHLDDEAWYVLDGALVARVADRDVEVPAGGAVLVPRGTPHTYWNPLPGPTRYLIVMTARIAALIDALHALEDHDDQTLATTFDTYASTYLGWP